MNPPYRTPTNAIRATLAVTLAALVALPAGQALATHVSCGAVITTDTRLDSDLRDCPGDGLAIGAGDVTLDLGGHAVTGTGAGTGIDNGAGHDGVRITNGSVSSFSHGIVLIGADDNRLTRLAVAGNALGGISLVDGSDRNRVEHNTVSDDSLDGIFLLGSAGNRIEHNTLTGNDSAGIALVERSGDNRVRHNALSGNGVGIAVGVSDRNRIEHNALTANGVIGIVLEQSRANVVAKNSASHNELFGILLAGSDDNRLERNRAASNGVDGILVEQGSSGTLLSRNRASANGDDGIDVDDPATTLTGNVARANGDLGIEAVGGVSDAGGNRAGENVNAAQCENVACS